MLPLFTFPALMEKVNILPNNESGRQTRRELTLATPSQAPEITRSAAPRFARNRFTGLLAMRTGDTEISKTEHRNIQGA